MANYKPVIPRADIAFDLLQRNLIASATAHQAAWAIPLAELMLLEPYRAAWEAAWAAAKIPASRTSAMVIAKNEARAIFEARLRPFIQRWIVRNPNISETGKQAAGIESAVKSRQHIPRPDTVPSVAVTLLHGSRARVFFKQGMGEEGCSRRGKPYGVKFCNIAYSIGTKPASPADCISAMMTRSPHIIGFNMSHRGQMVYYFAQWVNARGEGGAWSQMKDFIIP